MDIRFGARAAARPALGSQDHKKRNGRDLHLLPQELDYVAFNSDNSFFSSEEGSMERIRSN